MKPPVRGYRETLPQAARDMLGQVRSVSAIGTPQTVRTEIEAFVERTQADELVVSVATFYPAAQQRSLELTMDALA